ncbi:MAG TPA: hypothetical protein VFO16_24605 [Pseudonocardiaceae bacterium]|nr:hypothetical protein [Pseudonocardiaceae bacterium]
MLRFEAITHNTKQLRCGRVLDRFGEIVSRLTGMAGRFRTTLDCLDTGFLPDHILDELPLPSQIGTTRAGGIDLNKPRTRAALSAVLALAAAPGGFTVADVAARVHTITGNIGYTVRHAAYDLRKLRGKQLITNPADPAATRYPHQQPAPSPHF